MSRRLLALLAAAGFILSGCASISESLDSINPFTSSAPKMAPVISAQITKAASTFSVDCAVTKTHSTSGMRA